MIVDKKLIFLQNNNFLIIFFLTHEDELTFLKDYNLKL